MSNELVISNNREITPTIVQMAELAAAKTYRYLGVAQQNLAAVYLKGYELGFKMTASPEFIQAIQGKPTLSPKGHLALLHASGLFSGTGFLKVEDERDTNGIPFACTVHMRRNDSNVEYRLTFTMDDARQAGIIKSDGGWDKYPANMLRWRAIGYCADVVAPDIGGGMLRAHDLGAKITADGGIVIEGEIVQDMSSLIDQYGADLVLQAANATGGDVDAMGEWLRFNDNRGEK